MHVDRTNGYSPSGLPNGTPAVPKPGAAAGDLKRAVHKADDRTETEAAAWTRQALAADEIDRTAVAEARRLLESGQLATPQAMRKAAESLLERGI
jgi:hypothetical protein